MKYVFANRYFYPDQSATSRMVSALAFGLAQRGFPITIVTGQSLHDNSRHDLPARETINDVTVIRLPTSRFGRQRLVGRAIDYLTFHISAFFYFLRYFSSEDIAVVCTDPPLLSVSAGLALKLRRAHLVNWVMDLFPETALELGVLKQQNALSKLLTRLRDWSLHAADLTVCPTATMMDFLAKKGVPRARLTTLHHWSDSREIYPVSPDQNGLRSEWGLTDRFVIGYSGNFGRAHEFETLLDAAANLQHLPHIQFLMIGGGKQHEHVVAGAKARGLTNMQFKPLQPAAHIAESLSAPDIHIVSLLPQLEHCIIPSKLYGILAAGRPTLFVGDRQGEVSRVIRAAGCGEAVEIGDVVRLTDVIAALSADPARVSAMGASARRLLEADYVYDHAVDSWASLLSAIHTKTASPARASKVEQPT